jgi:hypothetical protein
MKPTAPHTVERRTWQMAGEQRHFYHSFPRDKAVDPYAVLKSFLTNGFLLTPEVLSVPLAQASKPFTTLQLRMCFTELAPSELAEHAETFGQFSLKLSIEKLRTIGGLPVIYFPHPSALGEMGNATGGNVLLALIQAHAFIRRFIEKSPVGSPEEILLRSLADGLSPPDTMCHALEAVFNLYAFTENPKYGKLLAYYQQREWRLGYNFTGPDNKFLSNELTQKQKKALLSLNKEFFNKLVRKDDTLRRIDVCRYIPKFGDKPIMSFVDAVVAPQGEVEKVKKVLKHSGFTEISVEPL